MFKIDNKGACNLTNLQCSLCCSNSTGTGGEGLYQGTGYFGPGFSNAGTTTPDSMTINNAISLLRQPNTYYPTQFGIGIGSGDSSTIPDTTAVVLGPHNDATGPNNADYTIAIGNFAGQMDQGTNCVAIGNEAGYTGQIYYSVAVGPQAGSFSQGFVNEEFPVEGGSVAIGVESGMFTQGSTSVAVGAAAGASFQGIASVAVGFRAGVITQGENSTAIGYQSGQFNQGFGCIAIGGNAGNTGQSSTAISIGLTAGSNSQGNSAIAIGVGAGYQNQGTGAIALGSLAGYTTQDANSIIINATGIEVDSVGTSTCVITPIRNFDSVEIAGSRLHYDNITGEVTYGTDEAPSSIQYKTNIVNMSDTYNDKILNLRPVEFTYTSSNKPGIGFIAEEVDEIIPEIVKRRNDVIESLDYQFLVAPLVKIIQKHNSLFQKYDERINELEKLIELK